ncbi:MAG: dephospho-CoA kinase [Candidatus Aenigmatarchaeota archaeon]
MNTMRNKRIIGITGSFGSGKTTVANIFKDLGAYVIDADKIAKQLMKNKKIKSKIKNEFGTINRKNLSDVVFSDKRKLLKLNKIVHPIVIKEIKNRIKKSKNKIIVVDVPLLFEAKMEKFFDKIIVVNCDKKMQIKRLIKKGFEKRDILKRIKSQLPIEKKLKFADYVIDNNMDIISTKKQVKKIWVDINV